MKAARVRPVGFPSPSSSTRDQPGASRGASTSHPSSSRESTPNTASYAAARSASLTTSGSAPPWISFRTTGFRSRTARSPDVSISSGQSRRRKRKRASCFAPAAVVQLRTSAERRSGDSSPAPEGRQTAGHSAQAKPIACTPDPLPLSQRRPVVVRDRGERAGRRTLRCCCGLLGDQCGGAPAEVPRLTRRGTVTA